MVKKITFACVLPNGIHARPASNIEKICKQFVSAIEWHNLRTNVTADAKSVLSLISSNTLLNDNCHLLIDGIDEEQAYQRLSTFIENEFPFCDEALTSTTDDEITPLPRSLSNLNPHIIRAKAVCGGVATGVLKQVANIDLNKIGDFPAAESIEEEQNKVKNALTKLTKVIALQIECAAETSKDILSAHQAILEDPSFYELIELNLSSNLTAGAAIINTAKFFSDQLINSGSEYLKERVLDIRDVCFQLLQQIYGENQFSAHQKLTTPTICIAEELTPSQFLELDKKYLKGLLLVQGGTTSHTVILARSFNIPTLVGVDIEILKNHMDKQVQIDEIGRAHV